MLGPWAAAKFVSDAQRIGNVWLSFSSPCISIRDCILSDEIEFKINDLVSEAMGRADKIEELKAPFEVKEMRTSAVLQSILRTTGTLVLQSMEDTGLSRVVKSGAKGNTLNLAQISALAGQQSISGMSLSHFILLLVRSSCSNSSITIR